MRFEEPKNELLAKSSPISIEGLQDTGGGSSANDSGGNDSGGGTGNGFPKPPEPPPIKYATLPSHENIFFL